VDGAAGPFENLRQSELRARVEEELRQVQEPYRTTVILRDLEELSYEEIAEVMETSLGTVKSRLMRGRDALKKRLEPYIRPSAPTMAEAGRPGQAVPRCGREIEVTS
jgi:RNA polymerase sigma-70 factor (ECF subfamily)